MGASRFYAFRKVVLPILLPTVLAVIVLTFNNLLGNYDLSVFLYHPAYKPLGIVIKTATEETSIGDAKALMFIYSVIPKRSERREGGTNLMVPSRWVQRTDKPIRRIGRARIAGKFPLALVTYPPQYPAASSPRSSLRPVPPAVSCGQ